MKTRARLRHVIAAAALGMAAVAAGAADPNPDGGDAFVRERTALRHRPRRIILNNDGCDCRYFPADKEPTPANFLALRTSPLAGSQVDAVFYCTISSGFSSFTHTTAVGTILARQVGEELNVAGRVNITQALIHQGTDPLRLVNQWCHANGIDCFWSFRMNDTHDGAQRPHRMDTTDAFHAYRIERKGRDIRVFVDGRLSLDGAGRLITPLPGRNDIRFGASNRPNVGEALWQSVKLRFRSASATLYDMVLSVRYP